MQCSAVSSDGQSPVTPPGLPKYCNSLACKDLGPHTKYQGLQYPEYPAPEVLNYTKSSNALCGSYCYQAQAKHNDWAQPSLGVTFEWHLLV